MIEASTLLVVGTLLTIIAALMGWQALAIIKAGNSIVALQTLLKEIAEDVKKIGHHDSLIAVLDNKVVNLKAETTLLFEKFREIEKHGANFIHR